MFLNFDKRRSGGEEEQKQINFGDNIKIKFPNIMNIRGLEKARQGKGRSYGDSFWRTNNRHLRNNKCYFRIKAETIECEKQCVCLCLRAKIECKQNGGDRQA